MTSGLNILVGGSPAVLSLGLTHAMLSAGLVALFLQLAKGSLVLLLGSLVVFAGFTEFIVRLVFLLQYFGQGIIVLLLKVG